MDTTNLHATSERFFQISCRPGHSAHIGNPGKFTVQLFFDRKKLRSHALRHLADQYELSNWKMAADFELEKVNTYTDAIKKIGCPFFTSLNLENPPCMGCRKYKDCTVHATVFEEIYQQCILEIIRQGLETPRNVGFENKEKQTDDYWAASSFQIVVKMQLKEDHYIVTTSFHPQAGSKRTFFEHLDQLTRNVNKKAARNTINWCTEETWNISGHQGRPEKYRKKSRKKSKNKPYAVSEPAAKKPYSRKERGGSKNRTRNFYHDDE